MKSYGITDAGPSTLRQPEPTRRATDWRDQAACAGADTEVFFPLSQNGKPREGVDRDAEARLAITTYCDHCLVAADCLTYALDRPELTAYGVWGGPTVNERKRLRRTRRRAS